MCAAITSFVFIKTLKKTSLLFASIEKLALRFVRL